MQRLGYVYKADLALKDEWGLMVEGWINDTGNNSRAVLSQDCLHDLLTNCAWWGQKMEETYRQYKRVNRLPVVPLHGDLIKVDDGWSDTYRVVDN
jgi:hypothetical protein